MIRILSSLGFSAYKAKTSLNAPVQNNYYEYEKILKRKNGSYTFRNIDFYSDPGYSLDTISISQGEIIDGIIKNAVQASNDDSTYNDIFVTAPTGSGKSILFQIPAIYLAEKYNLFTIVVSPLINQFKYQFYSGTLDGFAIGKELLPEYILNVRSKVGNFSTMIIVL